VVVLGDVPNGSAKRVIFYMSTSELVILLSGSR